MPNIDINIAAATTEMRAYSLSILRTAIEFAGDVGVPCVLIGPGKANPLSSLPKERLLGHFFAALDQLAPLAERVGTTLAVENLPIAFLPDGDGLMAALDRYGDPRIGVIFDFANAVFAREDPVVGLRRVRERLRFVHVSDTTLSVYRHDPVGRGVVPFGAIAAALADVALAEPTILEIISDDPDNDIRKSADRLVGLGWGNPGKN